MEKQINIKNAYYAFSVHNGAHNLYFYETDNKYFIAEKPEQKIIRKNPVLEKIPTDAEIIDNPWLNWESNNPELITAKDTGIPINCLKTTDQDFVQLIEDKSLVDLYSKLIETGDISSPLSFDDVMKWHFSFLKNIYPFAGRQRTVEMSKSTGDAPWLWRVEFLNAIPELDNLIKTVSAAPFKNSTKKDIEIISFKLSELMAEFLFIHPFREGNGRICRLLGDIILAKNGFPIIGMNLKAGEKNYINAVQEGYRKNYLPLSQIIEDKIILKMKS